MRLQVGHPPVVYFVDCPGFLIGLQAEKSGTIRHGVRAMEDPALADFLAARPAESVRAVQGMVQRVLGEAAAQRVEPSPALAREVLDVMEIGLSRGTRRPDPRRGSGILTPGMGQVRSPEKTVMHWPSAADRLLAELR